MFSPRKQELPVQENLQLGKALSKIKELEKRIQILEVLVGVVFNPGEAVNE
jgi:hypothetical protein